MSEEIKNLNESVTKLVNEYRDLKETGLKDVVQKDQFDRMGSELKSEMAELREAVAAKNTPSVETSAEEVIEQAKEAVGEWFVKGQEALSRDGGAFKVKDVSLNIASEGGVFLPKVFTGLITDLLRKSSPIRNIATVVRSGQTYVHPIKTGQGTGKTRTEKGAVSSTSTVAFDLLTFVPFEVYDEQAATHWAHDGDATVNLVDIIIRDVLAGIGEKESEMFIKGTVNNTMDAGNVPCGIAALTPYTTSVDRFTNEETKLAGVVSATADAVTFDDVIKLRQSLHSKYAASGRYLMASETETSLITIKDDNGNYIWSAGDVVNGNPGRLFGHEYLVCDHMPTVANDDLAPLIIFGDFSKYVIADASDIRWTVDPITNKTLVKYLGRRRTAGSVTDFQAFRALFNKADA